MKYVVYGIIDPSSDEFFYVGHAENFRRRKAQHLKGSSQISGLYIRLLEEQGQVPHFCILERCPSREDAMAAEVSWTRKILGHGFKLMNSQAFNGYAHRQAEKRRLTRALEALQSGQYRGDDLVHIANGRDYNRADELSRKVHIGAKKTGFSRKGRLSKRPLSAHERRRYQGMMRANLSLELIATNLGRDLSVIEAEHMKF